MNKEDRNVRFVAHLDSAGTTTLHTSVETVKPFWILPLACLATVVCGCSNMLLLRWINGVEVRACRECEDLVLFRAPIFIQLINALSQAMWLPIFGAFVWLRRPHIFSRSSSMDIDYPPPITSAAPTVAFSPSTAGPEFNSSLHPSTHVLRRSRQTAPKAVWILPGFLDLCSSLALLLALAMVPASSVAILRNMSVLVCACLSICMLKRKYKLFNWIGILIISVGLTLTAVVTCMHASDNGQSNQWEGQLLILASTVFSVLQYLEQERLFRKYDYNSISATGWAGCFQTLILLVLCLLAYVSDLEDISLVCWQISTQPQLQIALGLVAASVAIFMASSFAVTKQHAALLACILHAMRQVIIWITEVALGWERFSWTSLAGLSLSVLGFLIFQGWLPMYGRCWKKEFRVTVAVRTSVDDFVPDLSLKPKTKVPPGSTPLSSAGDRSTDVGSSTDMIMVPRPDHSTYIRVGVTQEWLVDDYAVDLDPSSSLDHVTSPSSSPI